MRSLLLILLSLAVFTCSKEKSAPVAETSNSPAIDQARSAPAGKGLAERDEKAAPEELGPVGLVAPVAAQGRLLEYHVALRYRTSDLLKGRELLYAIASRRGFLRSSSAYAERSSMSVEMAVRASELYDTLKELDAVGDLLSENITVTDHSEANFGNQLKTKREELRGARRQQALTGDAAARNWAEREAALERSEDASDQAQLEKWKIQDHVNWATISVELTGPELPASVHVPAYRDAFVGLLNLILSLFYAAIYVLPILVVLIVLFARRRVWLAWFKRH